MSSDTKIGELAKDLMGKLKEKTDSIDGKKIFLKNLPYILAGCFCDKAAWLFWAAEGSDAFEKLMAALSHLDRLFSSPLLSLHPKDLLTGICGGAALWLAVQMKSSSAKKFRKGVEYGSARWSA